MKKYFLLFVAALTIVFLSCQSMDKRDEENRAPHYDSTEKMEHLNAPPADSLKLPNTNGDIH